MKTVVDASLPKWVLFCPPILTVVAVATLVTTVSIMFAEDQYLGGLSWPYFSDTGRQVRHGWSVVVLPGADILTCARVRRFPATPSSRSA